MNLFVLIIHDYTKVATEKEQVACHTETKGYVDRKFSVLLN
jgi:hypothetical protein